VQHKWEKQAVYNITVEWAHCYYANWVLVQNCDSLAGAVAMSQVNTTTNKIYTPDYI